MRRRSKVPRTRRPAPGTRTSRLAGKKILFELLEERYLFSAAAIIAENALPGTPQSVWDLSDTASDNIEGFATQFSINHGNVQQFKVNTDASAWHIDIYRMGYYQGNGARFITTINPMNNAAANQPNPITDLNTGLVDAGNWAVTAQWAIPANAVSGVYIGDLIRDDGTFGESQIIFVVRDDSSTSDIVFKTADSTWQAYNDWGNSSLYGADLGAAGRSYEVSYNRPFTTRDRIAANFYFGAEWAATEFLEQNGYDVTYVASMDLDRNPSLLLNHKMFLSVGHDEYWSAGERDAVTNARDAGVNLTFLSGNEMFWKTYWASSIAGPTTAYTTLVCYKETHDNAVTDPANPNVWTGTWRDPRFSPPADGGRPENAVTGTLFTVNGDGSIGASITVPAADASLRFWRNTSVANLTGNQTATLGQYVLGYEWDEDIDNGFRPAGLIDMSSTTLNVSAYIQDYGSNYAPGTATHSLTLYRAASGALVFGAGTIQYSWGLSSAHDGPSTSVDKSMQQATINLFADMGLQPGSLMKGMVAATMSTDHTAPKSTITSLVNNTVLTPGVPVTIKGTAQDSGGGVVAGVEISVDGGTTWHPTTGRTSWSYTWTPRTTGQTTIMTRAIDDSGNIEIPTSKVTVNPNLTPGIYSLFGNSQTPAIVDSGDGTATTVGMQFRSDVDALLTGIKFFKASNNTGTHVAALWTTSGQLLATATFTNETASGWQQVNFSSPVQIQAGVTYVASYYAPNGHYSADRNYFSTVGVDNGPLHGVANGSLGENGVYSYGNNVFPTQTYQATNYWVDVVLNTQLALDNTPPVVQSIDAAGSSGTITTDSSLVVKFSEPLNPNSITSNTVELVNPSTTELPSGCCGTPSGWCSGCPLSVGARTTVVSAKLTYDPTNYSVTITPLAPLSTSAIYTVLVKGGTGGVTDLAGNPVAADTARAFITPAQPASIWSSIWPSTATPATVDSGDGQGIELGVKVIPSANGYISGVEFYKSAANTGTHTGSLWTSSGQLLATGTFTGETASGWQTLTFSSPVAVTAGVTYVASYHTTAGHYSVTRSAFASALTSGNLQVPVNGGVYLYGAGGFPTQTSQSSNYWVDVVMHTTPPVDNIAPTVLSYTPSGGTTAVSPAVTPTVTFSEAIDPSTISSTTIKLLDGGNNLVPAALSYDTASHTVTITPTAPLANLMQYTIFVMGGLAGVKDAAGNPVAQNVGSLFTTDIGSVPSTTPPSVLYYNPATGATNVPINGSIVITFNKPLNAATVDINSVLLLKNGVNRLAETVTYNPANNTVTITPSAPLLNATSYTIYIIGGSTGVGDLYGNSMAGSTTSTFTTVGLDSTPPTVTSITPANGTTSVATGAPMTVTFSEALNPATVNSSTVYLVNASNATVPTTVVYNAANNTVTLTPTAALAGGTTYSVVVRGGTGGVQDVAGNALASTTGASFTTVAPSTTSTLFSSTATPATLDSGDGQTVELGVKFTASANGYITGVRYYKSSANTGTHTGSLWSSTGQLLATATFTGEGGSGWQQVLFSSPVAVTAGTTYVASYHTTVGHYSVTRSNFASAMTSGSLAVPTSGGVYLYGNGGFPTQSYQSTNYWVDVVFSTATTLDTTPPKVTSFGPAAGATNVATSATATVTFSEAVNAATVTAATVSLRDASNNIVPATVSYNSSNNTATVTPTSPLTGGLTYTIFVQGGVLGVKDTTGNPLANNATSTFSTTAPDTTPPTVASISPASGSANVSISAPITITFSEAMNASSISSSTVTLKNSSNLVVAATVTYNAANNTATVTPTGALAYSASYTITVLGGALGVKDVAGNTLVTSAISSFTTAAFVDTTPPAVTGVSPASGTTNVATSATVTVTFSEALNAATVSASTITLKTSGNVAVAATVSYNAANSTATLTPTSPLAFGTSYVVSILGGSSGVKDVAGNALAATATATFSTVAAPDTTPPTVTGISPTSGATAIATGASITISFSETLNPASVSGSTILLSGPSGAVAATVAYNAANNTVTLTPNAALANSATYTVTIVGGSSGVKDVAGNALAANVTSTFTTAAASTTTTIWPAATTPATLDSGDGQAIELGVKFTVSTSGYITGIRYYKSAANTGTHTGSLWSSTGKLLATATFTGEGGSGWQQVMFANPVAVTAGTTYVASYHTTTGHYSASRSYFTSAYTSGQIKVPANGGVYQYGAGGFPTQSYQSTNYWVDVLLSTTPPADTTPPTITSFSPASGTSNVSTGATVTIAFSEALNAATVTAATVSLKTSANVSVSTTVAYNAANNTVTLTPTSPLAAGTSYVVTVVGGASGVKDVAGNSLAATATATFATAVPDTTPPTVTSITPAAGATAVSTGSSVTVTFSEALNPTSVTSSTIVLRNASNVVVPATVTYNAANNTATLTPTSALANSTAYTVTVVGGASGVKDASGNALAQNATSTFTTAAVQPATNLWTTSTTPAIVDSGDTQAVELGTRFTATTNGTITGIRFYKSAANTGVHTGSLWSSTGQLLATGTFVNETASGWQTLVFNTPVAITAGTTYVASYHTTSGHYSVTRSYFSSAFTSGSLKVPASGGVYLYGAGGFPTQTYQSSNYWVDVLFTPAS